MIQTFSKGRWGQDLTERQPIFIIAGVPGADKSSVATELVRRFDFDQHLPVDDLREFVVAGIARPVPVWTAETGQQFAPARLHAGASFAVTIDNVARLLRHTACL